MGAEGARIRWVMTIGSVLLAVYPGSYLWLRIANVDVWPHDGHAYVIVPPNARWLYYVYRPMMYLDASITGMRFHIGPHQLPG